MSKRAPEGTAVVEREVRRLLRENRIRHEWGTAEVEGETVRYDLCAVDARTPAQRSDDERRGGPAGPVIVVIPGHGQTVGGPRKLIAAAALFSRSKIAWCIDPVPSRGGDCSEAMAIAATVRKKLRLTFPQLEERGMRTEAVLIGWSHGGSEALRAAAADPDLFPSFVGLCPTGMVERRPLELSVSFVLEALRITLRCLGRRRWTYLLDTLHLGADFGVGMLKDLWRARSVRKLVADVMWASRRVPGPDFSFTGQVLVVWGREDSVIRWRDVFANCTNPDQIDSRILRFQMENFPCAQRVDTVVVDGDHVSPEADALGFLRVGLGWLDQLDDPWLGR